MAAELTAADVSWRARHAAVIQDALRGAVVTDSAVNVYEDGSVKIVFLEVHLPDGRFFALSPPATVLEANAGETGWHNATVQQDFAEPGEGAPAGSILVLNRTGGLSAMPAPDFCPHKDGGCPGSDCCEEGDRCARAAARGRC